MKDVKDYIRSIPDFPEKGIIFRDITSLLQDADGLRLAIDKMQECVAAEKVDIIAGTESRGFIFGMPIAYNLHMPFIPIRKKGKLPCQTISIDYTLEYGGVTTLEIHKDAIKPGQRVALIDDLMATGGTLEASVKLIEELGGIVAVIVTLIELPALSGREHIKNIPIRSIVSYEGA